VTGWTGVLLWCEGLEQGFFRKELSGQVGVPVVVEDGWSVSELIVKGLFG
jgi:hypothetical protein